jgi:hypothetical protein
MASAVSADAKYERRFEQPGDDHRRAIVERVRTQIEARLATKREPAGRERVEPIAERHLPSEIHRGPVCP